MANLVRRRLERGFKMFDKKSSNQMKTNKSMKEQQQQQHHTKSHEDQKQQQQQQEQSDSPKRSGLFRQMNAINSLSAIKLKMLIFVASALIACHNQYFVQAGFFTFYFPNILKPKGYGELTDMIDALDAQVNQTRDTFSDTQYFWGQLQRLDTIESDYPEESACSEVFPMFRELAIAYTYADYEHYIKPFELYKLHLQEARENWYPAGLDSTAALPRKWEQQLYERELDLKIEWLDKLTNTEQFKEQREHLRDIWKSVRRSLDSSVACIYSRYAYRQIAEDINQLALEENLESMREAMKVLKKAYKRVEYYKESDKKIIDDIEDEIKKVERFTISATGPKR